MARWRWVIFVLLPVAALAGCLGNGGPREAEVAAISPDRGPVSTRILDDPAGDAYRDSTWVPRVVADAFCRSVVPPPYNGNCSRVYNESLRVAQVLGPKAADSLDGLGINLVETPTMLDVELILARLDKAFSGAASTDGREGAIYWVCWSDFYVCVATEVFYDANGKLSVDSAYGDSRKECNDNGWCSFKVPMEAVEGAPGILRWSIPRDLMRDADVGSKIIGARFGTLLFSRNPSTRCGDSSGVVLICGNFLDQSTDFSESTISKPYDWRFAKEPYAPPDEPYAFADPARDASDSLGQELRTLDVLRVEISESPQTLVLSTEVAAVERAPRHAESLHVDFGLPSGRVYEAGFNAKTGGTRDPWGGYCSDTDCSRWVDVPVDLTVATGSPGWFNLTFSRRDMEPLHPRDHTNLLKVDFSNRDQEVGTVPPYSLSFFQRRLPTYAHDSAGPGPAYWFRYESDLGGSSGGTPAMTDPRRDTVAPYPVGGSGALDLTNLEILALESDEYKMTLGVGGDPRGAAPPAGFDAAVFAVGVKAEEGSMMAALYLEAGKPPQFFCSDDTLVLAEEKRDPITAAMELIKIRGSSSGNQSKGSGTITFRVPVTCFGLEAPDPLHVQAWGGGTYLIRRSTPPPTMAAPYCFLGSASVCTVDDRLTDEPFLLETLSVAASAQATPKAAWYTAPFGIENFWDMLGLATAGVFSASGVFLYQRKRRVLKRYLGAIDHAANTHPDNPKKREDGLLAVRARLKDELMNGRLAEGQYVLVEKRLDEHLARARVEALADSFGDLPHRLLLKFQERLVDGVLSSDDYRDLATLVEDTGFTPAAKQNIRRKLKLWVAQDRT